MDHLAQTTYSTINDLRIKKQNAIDVLDFETAESYENQIQTEIANFAKYQMQDALTQAKFQIEKYRKYAEKRLEDEAEESRKNTQMIYSKYQVLVESTEERHISELMEIEQDRTYTLITESERDVDEQIKLLEEAKAEAKVCHFDKAKELRQQAHDVAKEELERRRVETETKFAQLKETTIQNQKDELEKITKDHETEVNKEHTRQEKQFENSIKEFIDEFKMIETKSIANFNAVATKNVNLADMVSEIKEVTQEQINYFKGKQRVVPVMQQYEKLKIGTTKPPKVESPKPSMAKTTGAFPNVAERSFKAQSAFSKTTNSANRSRPMSSIGLLSLRPMSRANRK